LASETDSHCPRYVCHIDRTSLASSISTSLSQQTVFATPVSRLLPRIRMRTRQAPTLLGQKILVSIDRWDASSKYPDGHFVRALGTVESKEAETESLLLEFDVPYRPFGKAILDCLPSEGESWVVPPKDPNSPEWRDREDLRGLLICSIDPPSECGNDTVNNGWLLTSRCAECQDIDDALHARQLENGNIEAGVRESHHKSFERIISDIPTKILPTFPTLSCLITQWTPKLRLAGLRFTLLTSASTCCRACWAPICAH